ncbi:MAG: hypothetical protein ACRC5H_10145 [Treponemataceae bacterium]
MKKLLLCFCITIVFLSACSQEPIFADIEKEIKLREQTVKNYVYSVVEFGDHLYAANLNLFTKPKHSQDGWWATSKPGKLILLAVGEANGTKYLYGFTDTFQVLYRTLESEQWNIINTGSDKIAKFIFSDGKTAWVTLAHTEDSKIGGAYRLEGNTIGSAKEDGSTVNTKAGSIATGTPVFSDSVVLAYNHEDKIVYTLENIEKHVSGPQGAAYFKDNLNRKWIIVGIHGGIRRFNLNDDGTIPEGPKVETNLPANAGTSIGPYDVFPGSVWAFDNNSLFVAIFDKDNSESNGLWGYYSSRDTWNRE